MSQSKLLGVYQCRKTPEIALLSQKPVLSNSAKQHAKAIPVGTLSLLTKGSPSTSSGHDAQKILDSVTTASAETNIKNKCRRKRKLSDDPGGRLSPTESPRLKRTCNVDNESLLGRGKPKPDAKSSSLEAANSPVAKDRNLVDKIKEKSSEKLRERYMKLKTEGRLPELKESLAKVKESTATLLNVAERAKHRELTKPATEVKKAPAYERFKDVADEKASSTLVLPYKYRILSEMFRCMDTIVSFMYNRKEMCTFEKLKPAIQEMMRRTFQLDHLGKIKTVFPAAYFYEQEKVYTNGILNGASKYYLTVTPNMDCFSDSNGNLPPTSHGAQQLSKSVTEAPIKTIDNITNNQLSKPHARQLFRPMNPSFMLARRNVFYDSLLNIVKKHHEAFLASLSEPIRISSQLYRWHPKFLLDGVPDVVASELPQPKETQKYTTAKDVLDKVKGLYGERVQNALEQAARSSEDEIKSSTSDSPKSEKSGEKTSTLNGIPWALIQKIRAREAEKTKARMTRCHDTERKQKLFSKLPEIAHILRNFIIAEKKAAVSLSSAVNKINESYIGSVNPGEAEDYLKYLAELSPDWLKVIKLQSGTFVKIDKQLNFSVVVDKIECARKALLC